MKKIITTANAQSPVGAYSQATVGAGILYASGQIAIHPATGQLALDSIEAETRQVMKNLSAVLAKANSSFDEVLKCTIFLSDMKNYEKVNEVYAEYFSQETAPARECVQVTHLPKYANVEISLIAMVKR